MINMRGKVHNDDVEMHEMDQNTRGRNFKLPLQISLEFHSIGNNAN